MKSVSMAKKVTNDVTGGKPVTFRNAIWLALHTPHKTQKQILEERRKEKQLKNDKNLKK